MLPFMMAGGTDGNPVISNSLRVRKSASAYLSRTNAALAPTDGKKGAISILVRRGLISAATDCMVLESYAGASGAATNVNLQTADTLNFGFGAGAVGGIVTNRKFRDPNGFMHIFISFDSTQATAANRVLLWINGVAETSFSSSVYPALNAVLELSTSGCANNRIGCNWNATGAFGDFVIAKIAFVDGSVCQATDFIGTDSNGFIYSKSNAQIRSAVAARGSNTRGNFGVHGWLLDFTNTASTTTIGYDHSQSDTDTTGNNWTSSGISLTAGVTYDALIDVPANNSAASGTQPASNYATLNPLDNGAGTLSEANLKLLYASAAFVLNRATLGMSSGKWYWEGTIAALPTVAGNSIGIADSAASLANYLGSSAKGYGWQDNATKYNNAVSAAYGASYNTNDVIGVKFDADTGTLEFLKNNVSQGVAYSGIAAGTYFPAFSVYGGNGWQANFGQRPFSYTPPTGYKALCTANLGTPAIPTPNKYFDVALWTGTNSTRTISMTNSTMKTGLVWIKDRSNAQDHKLTDIVRGATKALISDTTGIETTDANGVTAFGTGAFNLGTGTRNYNDTNGDTYAGWVWATNGTSGATNTSGTVNSTVSADTTAGISICAFNSGAAGDRSFGHGLGIAPKMVVVKDLQSVGTHWAVYHSSAISVVTNQLLLDLTNAVGSAGGNAWGATLPTSTVVGFGSNVIIGANSNCIAYCFAEVAGFSKFGSYTGNGSTDGTFVYTGFRPRFVLVKSSTAVDSWRIYDALRPGYNVIGGTLVAEATTIESTAAEIDFLSNGFKLRVTTTPNAAQTYVYACFAECPIQYSSGR